VIYYGCFLGYIYQHIIFPIFKIGEYYLSSNWYAVMRFSFQ